MEKPADLDAVLAIEQPDRLAVVGQCLTALGSEADPARAAFLRRAAQTLLGELDDAASCSGVAQRPGSQVVNLVALLRRALRLATPWLRSSGSHVMFETDTAEVPTWVDPTLALQMMALALRDASGSGTPQTFHVVKVSAGGGRQGVAPWVWISSESLAEDGHAGMARAVELSAQVSALAQRVGARPELVALSTTSTTGKRALRLWLPEAPPDGDLPSERAGSTAGEPEASKPAAQPPVSEPAVATATPAATVTTDSPLMAPRTAPWPIPIPTPPPPVLGAGDSEKHDAIQELAAEAMEEFLAPDPRRVLVVDDEETLLGFFASVLPIVGAEFELVRSAEEALELIAAGAFSLAIVDKNLPGLSGLQLLPKLLEIDPHLGTLIMTGYASAGAVSEALQLGAYDFIEKPFPDLPVLLARLDVALRRQAMHARVARLADKLSTLGAVLAGPQQDDDRAQRLRKLLEVPRLKEAPAEVVALCDDDVLDTLRQAPLAEVSLHVASDPEALRQRIEGPQRPEMVLVEAERWPEPTSEIVALGRSVLGDSEREDVQVFVVTRDESLRAAVDAMQAGAADYVLVSATAPGQLRERLLRALRRLRLHRRDRAVVLDILNVDINKLHGPVATALGAIDADSFEPQLGDGEA